MEIFGAHLFDMTSDVLLIIARFFLAVKTVSSNEIASNCRSTPGSLMFFVETTKSVQSNSCPWEQTVV
jgi:hypothetical protein